MVCILQHFLYIEYFIQSIFLTFILHIIVYIVLVFVPLCDCAVVTPSFLWDQL